MSVIRHHPALPDQPRATLMQPKNTPGWHGLAAMTRPVSPWAQIMSLLRSAVRPFAGPIKRIAIRVFGQHTRRQIAELQATQSDLAMALQELLARRAAENVLPSPATEPQGRLVWISSWQTRCGIAEYSRHLIAALQAAEFGCQVTVLHDQRPTLPQVIPPHGIAARPGFILNGANNVAQLALGVAAERADYVVIQHHAALISWEHLADLLQHPAMAARCVVVALHNTQDILTLSPWLRQQLYVALRSVSRVVVHTPRDMALLHAFGLDNLYRLAHGCPAFAPSHPARDLPQQSAPLIGSSGFLLPHKGAQGLIRAVAALRDVWPDIRLRLVMAKYPLPTSEAEFRACANLARKLRFESHLEWHTAFMAENGVRRLLSECDLLVLPYGKTPEASSASARMAVASGAPTLVSEQAIFDDLHDAVGRVSPTVPGGLAGEIEQWLHTARRRDRLQQQARLWQAEHDWHIVGRQMAALLDSIVPDPRS